MKDIKELLIDIINSWDKKRGLFIALILFLGVYFLFVKSIIKEGNFSIEYSTLNLWIPISIICLLSFLWLISTKRLIIIPKSNKLTIGLFLSFDEEKSEQKIKKIAKKITQDIKEKHKNLEVKLYPFNFIKSNSDLKRYVKKNSHALDCAFYGLITSGKRKDENGVVDEVFEITEKIFSGKFNVNDEYHVFKTKVSLADDLNIRNINKKWSYIESNSYSDKVKIESNLKDLILFYSGIYLIYQKKPIESLNILKTLYAPEDSKAKFLIDERKIIGNQNFISASRLNDILINLFIPSSSYLYDKKDIIGAYNILKECEKMFGDQPQLYTHFIRIAKYTYELDNLEEAIIYNEKARKLKHYGTEIYMNLGFFSILNNDEKSLYENYKELSKVYKHKNSLVNYTGTIGWLEDEKKKKESVLFEFAIGTLNLFYSDKDLGRKILKKIHTDKLKIDYPKIHELIKSFLTKGETKSTYHSIRSRKKKRRKKRK